MIVAGAGCRRGPSLANGKETFYVGLFYIPPTDSLYGGSGATERPRASRVRGDGWYRPHDALRCPLANPDLLPLSRLIRLFFLAALLFAALPAGDAAAQRLSREARISLLTVMPGDALDSMYGHSALRVYDPARDIDVSFNYGTFDFDAWFLPRFLYGRLDYFLSSYPYHLGLRHYSLERRPIIEQVLNLSAAQKEAVFEFLLVNILPENRYYRYNFLFDNCSTRIRDAMQIALREAIDFSTVPVPDATFRAFLDPYAGPWLDAGIDLLLGAPVDEPIDAQESMFLPDHLMAGFALATVDTGGVRVPLVARTDTVLWVDNYTRAADDPRWAAWLLWALLAVGVVVTLLDVRTGRGTRRLLDVPLFLIAGFAGLLITFLWFISLHDVTAQNWNLLWAWPTHLWAAWVLFHPGRGRFVARYLAAAAAAALVTALGWSLWTQALPPAVLPFVLLLGLRAAWIARSTLRPTGSPSTS